VQKEGDGQKKFLTLPQNGVKDAPFDEPPRRWRTKPESEEKEISLLTKTKASASITAPRKRAASKEVGQPTQSVLEN
jgi:hypothetical protein